MVRNWKTPRKILCATDLAPACDRVIDRALQLASHWGAGIGVLHVVDDTRLKRKDAAARAHKVETELTQQVRGHPLASGLNVDAMVTLGNPTERILARCDRMFIDLLVMGPAERKSLGERLLGSTVDHVLRHALQPVLCVRNRAQAPYRKMAIATDFSEPSREALDSALVLFPEAKATVVHAYEDTLHGLLPFDQMTGPLAERHKLEMRAHVEKSISEFVEGPRAIRADIETMVEVGTPDAVLQRLAEQSACDLVVVGTHGRTGFRRALIGSVAERLIGLVQCDTLAVRPSE
jgi:nucleotide-binding universal stress UspA family protein